MAEDDVDGADPKNDADPDEPRPLQGTGPYPRAMHYQFLTPTAPLAPGAAARVIPAPIPPSTVPAQWAKDPTGRHEWRWWNGRAWTDQVADDGTAAIDPMS